MCSRVAQEVQLEKQEKKAKKLASVAAKLAAGNVENVPVQPVFPVPTGLSNGHVVAAVPFGSPVPMHAIASPLPPVPVRTGPCALWASEQCISAMYCRLDMLAIRSRLLDSSDCNFCENN